MPPPKDTEAYQDRLDRLERWTQRLTLVLILATAILFANFSLTFVQILQPGKVASSREENQEKTHAKEASHYGYK